MGVIRFGLLSPNAIIFYGILYKITSQVNAYGQFKIIPFAVSELSLGITPPPDGTPLDLWLTWQLALFLAITGPMVLASALLRGDAEPRARRAWVRVPPFWPL